MDANHMVRGGGTGTHRVPLLSSGDNSVGDYTTINSILTSGKRGSVSSNTLNPALAPPHSECEEETKEQEDPQKRLCADTNAAATIPMCDNPGTASTLSC